MRARSTELDDVRADMLRDCDTSVVHRCRVCGGVQTVHYGQPPECECPDERETCGGWDEDES